MINSILRIDCDKKNFHKFVLINEPDKFFDINDASFCDNEGRFDNIIKTIKEDEDLTFDDKSFILKVLSKKGIEKAVNSVCHIYDNYLTDDEREALDLDGLINVFSLKHHPTTIDEQFMRCVYFDDSKYDTKVTFGKNGTKISLLSIYDNNFFPTKEEWKKIRMYIKY